MELDTIDKLFNEIYDATYQKCLRFVMCKCSNTADISDIMQDTYLELYQSLLKHGSSYINIPEAYVMKLAKTKLYRYYSFKEKIQNLLSLEQKSEDDSECNLADFRCDEWENRPEEMFFQRENMEYIFDYLKTKSMEIQKIIYLFYYLDMTIPEIAKELKLTESTVKNRIYRTIHELKEKVFK